jgi:hypothetical protein
MQDFIKEEDIELENDKCTYNGIIHYKSGT